MGEAHPRGPQRSQVADDVKAPRARRRSSRRASPEPEDRSRSWWRRAITKIPVKAEALVGRRTGGRVVDSETGEVLVEANQEITANALAQIMGAAGGPLQAARRWCRARPTRRSTRRSRATTSRTPTRRSSRSTGGCARATRRPWSRRAPCSAACSSTPRRYDLARVGRFMINKKLGTERRSTQDAPHRGHRRRGPAPLPVKLERNPTDDIDHLGNRRVRSVGELLENQFRVGLDPHGAGDQGADVHRGHREPDAARPDQREAGLGGGEGVLRLLAALPVHGPDEPAGRADAQAPALGPRAAAVSRGSAPGSRCATFTRRTTGGSARSRRRKARTSA